MASTPIPTRSDTTHDADIDIEKAPPVSEAAKDKAQQDTEAPPWPRTRKALDIIQITVLGVLVPLGCALYLCFNDDNRPCRQGLGSNVSIAVLVSWFAYAMNVNTQRGIEHQVTKRSLAEMPGRHSELAMDLLFGYALHCLPHCALRQHGKLLKGTAVA